MEIKSKKYDEIKVLLIFLVVLGHITRMYTPDSVYTLHENINYMMFITNFIYGFHMPLFMMISGAVFSLCLNDLNKYKNKTKFIFTKAKRLIIPYLFIGIIILPWVLKCTGIINQTYIEYIIKGIVLGENSRHLWFLSNLFLIFIIFIFLPRKNNLSTFIIYTIFSVIMYVLNIYFISNLFYWSVFFYLGYLCHNHYDKLNKVPKYVLLIILVIYTFLIIFDINMKIIQLGGVTILYAIPKY